MITQQRVRPFRGFIEALKAKDADLYGKICHRPAHEFYLEWKRVHPEDFPKGGQSPADASSVMPK